MKHKLTVGILLVLVILFIPLVTSTTIGTAKAEECIQLYQVCENCTYNNITAVLYPNKTIAVSNMKMTNDSSMTYYNYTFCETDLLGSYIVNGFGNLNGIKTTWVYDFEVTGTGFEFTQSRSIYYIMLLGLLVFFFIFSLFLSTRLPTGNDADDYGILVGINKLKYLRPILYICAWSLLLAIFFTSSNIALAYLGTEMFGDLLFALYRIMLLMTFPMILIWTIFLFIQIFRDSEVKKMIERGADIGEI